jgi:hypothetical protein
LFLYVTTEDEYGKQRKSSRLSWGKPPINTGQNTKCSESRTEFTAQKE